MKYSNQVALKLNKGPFLNIGITQQLKITKRSPLHISPLTRNQFCIVLIHRKPNLTSQTLTWLLLMSAVVLQAVIYKHLYEM